MLATEQETPEGAGRGRVPVRLEEWAGNERMRHVPTLAWLEEKLDGDLRRRIERLQRAFSDLPASDERHPLLESEFRVLCRSLERVCDVARRHRGALHPPADLGSRIPWILGQTVAILSSTDAATFGRRFPFQTFERSNAEPLWAAVLTVIERVKRLTDLIRAIDPEIDEQLLEGLVNFAEPMPRTPIA